MLVYLIQSQMVTIKMSSGYFAVYFGGFGGCEVEVDDLSIDVSSDAELEWVEELEVNVVLVLVVVATVGVRVVGVVVVMV